MRMSNVIFNDEYHVQSRVSMSCLTVTVRTLPSVSSCQTGMKRSKESGEAKTPALAVADASRTIDGDCNSSVRSSKAMLTLATSAIKSRFSVFTPDV